MSTPTARPRAGIVGGPGVEGVPFDVPPSALTATFPDPEECERFLETVRAAVEANKHTFRRLQGTERWRSPAFEFTRRVRWLPELRNLTGLGAGEILHAALGVLFEQDKEEFLWEHLIGHSDTDGNAVDPYTDFLVCWDKLRGPGVGVLDLALAEVKANPDAESFLAGRLSGMQLAAFRTFLALCNRLQERAEEGVIAPAVEPVARLLGVDAQQVSRWRLLAVKYGYLEQVEQARRGRAAEFRFHPEPPGSP